MPYFKVNVTWPEGFSEQPYVWVEDQGLGPMYMENQAVDKVMGIYGLGRGSVQMPRAMPPDFNPQAIGGTVVGDTGYDPDLYETVGGWGQDEASARREEDAPYVPVANKNIPSGAGTGLAASSLSDDIMSDIGGGYSTYDSYVNPYKPKTPAQLGDAGSVLLDIAGDYGGGGVVPGMGTTGGVAPTLTPRQEMWLQKNLIRLNSEANELQSRLDSLGHKEGYGHFKKRRILRRELEDVALRHRLLLQNKGMENGVFTGSYGLHEGRLYTDPEGRTGIGPKDESPPKFRDDFTKTDTDSPPSLMDTQITDLGGDYSPFGRGDSPVAVGLDDPTVADSEILNAASRLNSELNIEGLLGFLDALAQPMIDPSTGLAIIPEVPVGLIESATREIVENIRVLDAAGNFTGELRPQVIGYELDPAIQAVLDMHQQRANFQELALNRISDRQIQDSQNRTNLDLADKTGRSQQDIAQINSDAARDVAEANGITERDVAAIMAGVQRDNVISQTGAEIAVADIESQMHQAVSERSGAAQESVAQTYASAQRFTATQQLRGIETQTEVDKYVADRSLEATRAGLTPRQYMGLEGTIARGGLPIPERMQLGRIQYTGGLEAPAFREMQETISRGGLSPEQVLEQEYIRKTGGLSPTDFGDLQMGIQRGGISPEQLLRQKELEYIGGLSPAAYAEHQMGMQRGGLTPDQRLAELQMAQQPQMFSNFANLLGNPVAVGTLQGLGANLGGMFGGGGGGMFGGGGGSGMLSGAAPISGRTLTADPNPTMPYHSWGQNRPPTLAQLNAPGNFAAMHTGRRAAKGLTPDQVYDESANVSPWSSQGEQSRYAIGGPLS